MVLFTRLNDEFNDYYVRGSPSVSSLIMYFCLSASL